MISGGESASFVLEATGNVERINLADASMQFGLKRSTNVGYSVVAENGLIPLLGLCKIQGRFLCFFEDFRPLEKSLLFESEVRDALEDSPRVQTEESGEALDFAQLR